MYQRRRARILLAVLVLIALVLITVDFRSDGGGGEGPLGRLRGIATTVFGPIQEGLSTVVAPIGDAVGGLGDLFSLREDNARLRQRLEALEDRQRSFEDLQRENDELRELLELRQRSDFDMVPARVVAQASSNYEWTITLDVGRADGVERDMVVVNDAGLVGRVIQVTRNAARVLLAIDPNFSAAARVARSAEQGSIEGRGGDLPLFLPFDLEAPMEPGDEIVTAAYSNGLFPPGIPIGTVEDIDDDASQLVREVRVRPFVDYTALDHVLVIRTEPIETVPPLDEAPDVGFEPPVIPSPDPTPSPSPSPSPEADA